MFDYEDKILNNNYDSVDYGTESLNRHGGISITPMVSDRYEESTTENIDEVIMRKKINSQLAQLYEASPFYQKYGQDCKKIDKSDLTDIYYTFKSQLSDTEEHYTIVQILCAIAEFFELNYKILYNDILTLEDKAAVLESLEDTYGLEQKYAKSKKLF